MWGLLRNWYWKLKWCHSNTIECNTQVQTLHCRYTCHNYTHSCTGERQDTKETTRKQPWNTITIHCNYSEYTPIAYQFTKSFSREYLVVYRQAATIAVQMTNYFNRRAVRPAGLLSQGSVQNAQKAKLSQLRHLPADSGGGLWGALHSSTWEVPAVYYWYLSVWWSLW